MTITITKAKLALAVLAIALIAPATALATHVFSDVDDSRFYADAVEWAASNGITTGVSPTQFAPEDNVTRGQNVTFLKRYHDSLVAPADAALQEAVDKNTADIDALQATTCSETVTGFRVYDHSAVADNEDWFIDAQLPCIAPVPLTSADVNFSPGALAADDDATCTGTAAEPTAPAGKVCLYLSQSSGVDNLLGFDSLIAGTTFDTRGFNIRGLANTAPGNDTYARVSWAYTPPAAPVSLSTTGAGADAGDESDGK